VLWLGIVGVVTTGTIAVFFDSTWWFAMTMRSAPISAVAFVMVMGMTSLVGQICLNLAWQAESAPPVTMVLSGGLGGLGGIHVHKYTY
jgi:hypothetical protein